MTYTPVPSQPTLGLNPWYSVETGWKDGVELALSEIDDTAMDHIADATVHTPSGGSTGQVLAKTSGADGAYDWTTPAAGVTDHGALTGLSDADHPIAAVIGLQAALDAKSGTAHTHSYEATGVAASLVTAHEVAADPHTQYMTSAEVAAAYAITSRGLPAAGSSGQILAKTSGADYAVGWIPAPNPTPVAPIVLTSGSDVVPLSLKGFAAQTAAHFVTQLSDNTHVLTVTGGASPGEVRMGPGVNTMSAAARVGQSNPARRVMTLRAADSGTGYPSANVLDMQKPDGTVLAGVDNLYYFYGPNIGRRLEVLNFSDAVPGTYIDGTVILRRPES